CVTNALIEAERLATPDTPLRSILFPLLGTGAGGADPRPTVTALLEPAIDHLTDRRCRHIREIYLLASTRPELDVCLAIFNAHPRLRPDRSRGRLTPAARDAHPR